ncbi:hypothetical protein JL720_2317 [Aureococcus anophagefferens]|nr:hypothetical protein JL720_2317 [Aureococcus anophagefferens]
MVPRTPLSWVVRASLDGDAPTGEFDVVEKAYLRGARAGGFVTAILENGEAKVSNPVGGHGNKPRNKSAAGRESLNRFEWRWLDDAAVAQARANSAAVAKEQEALQAPPPTLGDARDEASSPTVLDRGGKGIHTIRDHPNHDRPLNGGLWGGVKGAFPGMAKEVKNFENKQGYGGDLQFLNTVVWPVKNNQFGHDAYTCNKYPNSHPFPTKRPENYQHVGQVFNANDQSRARDINGYMRWRKIPPSAGSRRRWRLGPGRPARRAARPHACGRRALTVVVGVAVLDQRRVSKRNVRSHDTYWSHATYWPSRAARKTRLATRDGEERELVDGEAEGAGSEETEAPTAARAPMPWPTPAPRPKKKASPLFDDENVDDAATEFPTPER